MGGAPASAPAAQIVWRRGVGSNLGRLWSHDASTGSLQLPRLGTCAYGSAVLLPERALLMAFCQGGPCFELVVSSVAWRLFVLNGKALHCKHLLAAAYASEIIG